MTLVKLDKVSLAYGHVPLLDAVDFQVEENERVCLVGRNGTGKSTLMQIIRGTVQADDGQVWRKPNMRLAYLAQEVPENLQKTVYEIVTDGLDEVGKIIASYHQILRKVEVDPSEENLEKMSRIQQDLEAQDGWRLEQKVEAVITRLQLPSETPLSALSGGLKRRVMLAQALVTEPDLLLLDEPTNHLDVEGIQWLEDFISSWNGSLLFITHDRSFLQNLATRIVELDRGNIQSWPGDYQNYLSEKQHLLAVESEHNAKFDKKLAQEEVWIRQGIKARRTRNEGRVRALEALRKERSMRRNQQGKVNLNLDSGDSSGKIVVEVENASVGYEGRTIIKNFSTRIMRGDKVGIIGPNGVGKSTLLKLLLGQLPPEQGKVSLGTKLEVAYFDQQREQLDADKTVLDNLNSGSEFVSINGKERHIIGYLQDFLFPPQRVRSPVSSLSGGERNRLLLARLFTRPANILIMDEPTNDLDVETLELLEELLSEYKGTLLLVSHDRTFLDNVITNTLVFDGDARVNEYVGGYSDWVRQRSYLSGQENKSSNTIKKQQNDAEVKPVNQHVKSRKLSYKDQRELDSLPGRIHTLEEEQSGLQSEISSPDFYQRPKDEVAIILSRLEAVNQELESTIERWMFLEES